jgi:hypothetical protein
MDYHKEVWHNDEAAPRLPSKRVHDVFDFGVAMSTRCDRLYIG